MAIKIGSNFAYNGKLSNFERDSFKDKAAMKAFDENSIDEGHLSYCKEDGKVYQYKSTNTVDATTGKWRIFKTDIVVDDKLNGTSKNPIQNKAVFDALKLKANNETFNYYQLKYNANYVAKGDLDKLPINEGTIDLNGYTLTMSDVDNTGSNLTIINGIIKFPKLIKINVSTITFSNITIIDVPGEPMILTIQTNTFTLNNVISREENAFTMYNSDGVAGNITINTLEIYNSYIGGDVTAKNVVMFNSRAYLTYYRHDEQLGVVLTAINSTILDDEVSLEQGSDWRNCFMNSSYGYMNGYIDEKGYHNQTMYETTIEVDNHNAPTSNAVYRSLQLKADKTQLNGLATKTELSGKADKTQLNNYVTTTTANTTYAKKSDITNVYKFKGTKNTYNDLPKTDKVTGDVWNITTADANYGIKAGDNVAWNGTAWDNLSGTVDLSGYVTTPALDTKLVPYATIASVNDKLTKKTDVTTTDAMSADIKKLMDKAFPFTVKVSIDKNLAKKGTSQPVKVTITPKIGDDNTEVDAIMINGEEHHGTIPYVYSTTATTTTTYNVRADKTGRNSAQGSATITFVNPSYDGAVAANFTVTEANIKALTETLRSGKGETRTFNLNNQKACIAYPKAFGAATGIKDANGFDYLASYTRSELNVNGELYYVYLLTNATTITDMKQIVS